MTPVMLRVPFTQGQRDAITAIYRARKLWPGPIGNTLAAEIESAYDLLGRFDMRGHTRALIDAILAHD